MSDPAVGGPRLPQTFGEKISFSLPVIVVALILSIGISYAILAFINGNTRTELSTKLDEQEKKFTKDVGEVRKANDDLQKDLVALTAKTKTLEEEKTKMFAELNKMDDNYKAFRGDYSKFVDTQKDLDKGQNQDIQTTSANLKKVEDKVHYIDEKLKKLDEVAQDVLLLKTDTAGLKEEYKVLKGDLTAVRSKADVTEKDLADLSERARMFQLRVLAARAREAAEAARKTDLKNLLTRLEDVDVEEKK